MAGHGGPALPGFRHWSFVDGHLVSPSLPLIPNRQSRSSESVRMSGAYMGVAVLSGGRGKRPGVSAPQPIAQQARALRHVAQEEGTFWSRSSMLE